MGGSESMGGSAGSGSPDAGTGFPDGNLGSGGTTGEIGDGGVLIFPDQEGNVDTGCQCDQDMQRSPSLMALALIGCLGLIRRRLVG